MLFRSSIEIPDTPVEARAEVVFVSGKGGALDRESGAVVLCPVPLTDNGNVECGDTGSSEDLLPSPVPGLDAETVVIEEFPTGGRAVVDNKELEEFLLTAELVEPEVGAMKVDEFPAGK